MSSVTAFRGANDAAAPVVGIVLLVAVVVTLATLVSFSVLGIWGFGDASPSASWEVDVVETEPEDGDAVVVFAHRGGDAVSAAELDAAILGSGGNASLDGLRAESDRLSAGDTVAVTIDGDPGDELSAGTEIALVWEREERSAILSEVTLEEDVVIAG